MLRANKGLYILQNCIELANFTEYLSINIFNAQFNLCLGCKRPIESNFGENSKYS